MKGAHMEFKFPRTTANPHILQYDEFVFVWFDETDSACGAGSTYEQALAQLTRYADELNRPKESA